MAIPREYDTQIRPYLTDAPVRIDQIARSLGVRVWSVDLGNKISGTLFADETEGGDSGWAIYVNSTHPLVRQRFTVAHEIGHFCLHRNYINDRLSDDVFYRSSLSDAKEAEANAFAADLLMPWHLINGLTDRGINTPDSLAQALSVSQTAMNIRLGLKT